MILSILGRFSVAFLGFAYNLYDESIFTPSIYRPDWVNQTMISNMRDLTSTLAVETNDPGKKHHSFVYIVRDAS